MTRAISKLKLICYVCKILKKKPTNIKISKKIQHFRQNKGHKAFRYFCPFTCLFASKTWKDLYNHLTSNHLKSITEKKLCPISHNARNSKCGKIMDANQFWSHVYDLIKVNNETIIANYG